MAPTKSSATWVLPEQNEGKRSLLFPSNIFTTQASHMDICVSLCLFLSLTLLQLYLLGAFPGRASYLVRLSLSASAPRLR